MATILLTYEFGAGLGHLNRLLAVAKRLANRHRLVFALPDVALGESIVRRAFGDGVEMRRGVIWSAPTDPAARTAPTNTFADVIRLYGFDQPERLLEAVQRWTVLLRELTPDLIVSDFAPTLRLATMGRIPTVVVGNGYTVPPSSRPLPLLRSWETSVPPQSRVHEARLLAAVNQVRANLSGAAIDYFADLFHGESTFICTLSEFDPYRAWRNADPSWPFNIPTIAKGRDFRDRKGAAIFCYLPGKHPVLRQVLAAISGLGRRAEVYVQGVDPQKIADQCSRNVGVHGKPADFGKVLPEASLLIHHAGLGTAYAGLVAGVPQLVMPLNLEHTITTRGLESFGVAARVRTTPPLPDRESLQRTLEALLNDKRRQSRAIKAADELHRRRESDPLAGVIAACQPFL